MLKQGQKRYTHENLTVIWKPSKCIHSGKCINELPLVFNTSQTPWVNMNGAESDAIIQQVKRCPSGALSYTIGNPTMEDEDNLSQKTVIEILKDGPIIINSPIALKLPNGQLTQESSAALCRCGSSSNKPYCDGSHKKINFKD